MTKEYINEARAKVIVIGGPTASGKTDLAVHLAQNLNGEIVSADSMQIYRFMDIGTAKPTLEEQRGIPHHMIDIIDPDEAFSVAEYKKMAEEKIKDIISRGKIPIVAGGTGLYLNALIYNIQFSKTQSDWEFRERMHELAKEKGAEYLHEKLRQADPVSASLIHPNNIVRVIRALEVFETTKRPISEHQIESRVNPPEYDYKVFGLYVDREVLYKRIDARVDKMMEMGLIKEVEGLLEKGYTKNSLALQAIGYKELIAAMENKYSFDEAVGRIKLGTRHYAKRQLTWFKKIEGIIWMDTLAVDSWAMLKIFMDALNKEGQSSKIIP